MTKNRQLDPKSQALHHNWTRSKREKSQVNGHTVVSAPTKILKISAKAHRL